MLFALSPEVAEARDGAVHARAAHLFERHFLARDHLGHARRAEIGAGIAFDHDRDIGEGGHICGARRRGTEHHGDLRYNAGHLDLVVEGAPWLRPGKRRIWSVMRAPAESMR